MTVYTGYKTVFVCCLLSNEIVEMKPTCVHQYVHIHITNYVVLYTCEYVHNEKQQSVIEF